MQTLQQEMDRLNRDAFAVGQVNSLQTLALGQSVDGIVSEVCYLSTGGQPWQLKEDGTGISLTRTKPTRFNLGKRASSNTLRSVSWVQPERSISCLLSRSSQERLTGQIDVSKPSTLACQSYHRPVCDSIGGLSQSTNSMKQ